MVREQSDLRFHPCRLHYYNVLFNHTKSRAYGGRGGWRPPSARHIKVRVLSSRLYMCIWSVRVARDDVDHKSINRRKTRSRGPTCRYTDRHTSERSPRALIQLVLYIRSTVCTSAYEPYGLHTAALTFWYYGPMVRISAGGCIPCVYMIEL